MYFGGAGSKESESGLKVEYGNASLLAVIICVLFVIVIGIAPGSLIGLISSFLR
jgi:hypothetical protein